jgi:hypothetical protein
MREHPGAACRKALGLRAFSAGAALPRRAKRPCRTTATARTVSFRARQRARGGRASLISRVRQSALSRHRRQIRRGQVSARRILPALRTFMRSVRLGNRPHLGEGSASRALIVVNRHDLLAEFRRRRRAAGKFPARSQRACGWLKRNYLSGDIGISIPPVTCFVGPSEPGITSNANMSVGNHNVAQAFGISTTPEMWPCTGAVPKMA